MNTEDILRRIARIRVALEGTREPDITKFAPEVTVGEGRITIDQDFTGGMSEAQLEHAAYSMIHNIASLRDPMRRWAKASGASADLIDAAFASGDLATIVALDNRDKHGGPPRPGSKDPDCRLQNLSRGLQLTTGATEGSYVSVAFTAQGAQPSGAAGANVEVVIDAEVIDASGRVLGGLHATAVAAMRRIEKLLGGLGIALP